MRFSSITIFPYAEPGSGLIYVPPVSAILIFSIVFSIGNTQVTFVASCSTELEVKSVLLNNAVKLLLIDD
nr:MAG TPA: hypothetical protein [Caudoviricetes sp.]